jgi:hypothetical protein
MKTGEIEEFVAFLEQLKKEIFWAKSKQLLGKILDEKINELGKLVKAKKPKASAARKEGN